MRPALALLVSSALLSPLPVRGAESEPVIPVIDLRVELPRGFAIGPVDSTSGTGQADAVRLRRGGAYGIVIPVRGNLDSSYLAIQSRLSRSTELRLPGCRTRRPGIRTWLSVENASELAKAPTSVGLWTARGARFFGLGPGADNELATGSGLTLAGRDLVSRIHAAGGIVDVSRASTNTVRDVTGLARDGNRVVIASHANARALADDSRNLSDADLREIASTGGVIGIGFRPRQLVKGREATLRDVVRHVLHVARVAGIDHVAIGSGYETGFHPPRELVNATRYQRLGRALRDAGMPYKSARKVFATNALRTLCPR